MAISCSCGLLNSSVAIKNHSMQGPPLPERGDRCDPVPPSGSVISQKIRGEAQKGLKKYEKKEASLQGCQYMWKYCQYKDRLVHVVVVVVVVVFFVEIVTCTLAHRGAFSN